MAVAPLPRYELPFDVGMDCNVLLNQIHVFDFQMEEDHQCSRPWGVFLGTDQSSTRVLNN